MGTFIWRENIFFSQGGGAGKANEFSDASMPSPSLPYQLTSQVSAKCKAAAGLFVCVQAFMLRPILMTAEFYKHYSLKYNPLSSLPKIPWLTPFGLTRQPHVGAAAYSHASGLQTTWVYSPGSWVASQLPSLVLTVLQSSA